LPCLLHRAYPKGTIPAAGTAPSEGHCANNKHGAFGAVLVDGQKGGLRSRAKKDPRRRTGGIIYPGWGHDADCLGGKTKPLTRVSFPVKIYLRKYMLGYFRAELL
jgi:hypothetical protein